MKKAVTIRDVARRAGVSVATASRAMNGMQIVSEQTRERIRAVSEELGFTPSPAARRLSLGRTMTVGVIVSYLTRPQAVERLRGIDEVFADGELDLIVYNVESVQKRDHFLQTLADPHRHDGLLVVSLPPPPDAVSILERSAVPVVFVDVHVPAVSAMPRVVGDDVAGRRDRGAPSARPRPPKDRADQRCHRGPVRVHVEPRPQGRDGARARSRRHRACPTGGWGTASTGATRRVIWRCGCCAPPIGRRRSSRPATPRRSVSSPPRTRPASTFPRTCR